MLHFLLSIAALGALMFSGYFLTVAVVTIGGSENSLFPWLKRVAADLVIAAGLGCCVVTSLYALAAIWI